MRIVAGKFRGKNLVKSDHLKLRPTTDKNREALFNILGSGKVLKEIGFEISGAEVLDLCCGTGAVGFEALSRGAKFATFIDNNREHLELVKKNSSELKVEKDVKVICGDAKKLTKNDKNFDLIFIDPPYKEDYLAIVESLIESGGWVAKNSLIVVESQGAVAEFAGLVKLDERSYGKTVFSFYSLVDLDLKAGRSF